MDAFLYKFLVLFSDKFSIISTSDYQSAAQTNGRDQDIDDNVIQVAKQTIRTNQHTSSDNDNNNNRFGDDFGWFCRSFCFVTVLFVRIPFHFLSFNLMGIFYNTYLSMCTEVQSETRQETCAKLSNCF